MVARENCCCPVCQSQPNLILVPEDLTWIRLNNSFVPVLSTIWNSTITSTLRNSQTWVTGWQGAVAGTIAVVQAVRANLTQPNPEGLTLSTQKLYHTIGVKPKNPNVLCIAWNSTTACTLLNSQTWLTGRQGVVARTIAVLQAVRANERLGYSNPRSNKQTDKDRVGLIKLQRGPSMMSWSIHTL